MTILGWILLGIGGSLTLLGLGINIRIHRAAEPYTFSGLWAPELFAVLALLTGAGSWILWGWIAGVCVFVGHAVLGMGAEIGMRERSA